MFVSADGVVGNHLYSGRALGISEPRDIIHLHPDLQPLWKGIEAHYQRVGLPYSRNVIWNLDMIRPAVSEKRLSLTPSGNIRYQLKTPYSDGTTHIIFKPQDFIAWLAALSPKPRVNLTRFHGVFAPNSKYPVDVAPAKRGKGNPFQSKEAKKSEQRHRSMTWAQRLKRVFNINVSICEQCGGVVCSIPGRAPSHTGALEDSSDEVFQGKHPGKQHQCPGSRSHRAPARSLLAL
ncbi:MAG: hypothetical protein G8D81_18125 [gamma proteobacterium symbiont of Clathrolucina costata]